METIGIIGIHILLELLFIPQNGGLNKKNLSQDSAKEQSPNVKRLEP